jgi:hypothetical protein
MKIIKEIERKLGIILPKEAKRDIKKAIEFYKKFNWGKEITEIQITSREIPNILSKIGDALFLGYMSDKSGKWEPYVHVFQPVFPVIYVPPEMKNGVNYLILKGEFYFEKEGIMK